MNENADFESMCWHDNAIHGIGIREGADGHGGELDLDIDFILEWVKSDHSFAFRISPATLTFHEVLNLKVSIDYESAMACVQPMTIQKSGVSLWRFPMVLLSFNGKLKLTGRSIAT